MGYTTEFQGILQFKYELTASELSEVSKFLGRDVREHTEWHIKPAYRELYNIDFCLTKDFSGIEWDGSEKFYYALECVNLIIDNMILKYPDFGLVGQLECQGEDYDDRWILRMVDNKAIRIEQPRIGSKVTCPHCLGRFILEQSGE